MRGLLITGTDTGVGKTHAACLIARQAAKRGLRVGAYKPVCSGAERGADGEWHWDDIDRLQQAVNVPATIDEIGPQRFLAPLAPPVAARFEDRGVDDRLLRTGGERWRDHCDLLLIEGAGGLLCPLTETRTMADLAAEFGYPLVIIARPGLGTINHTLLTVDAARRRRLPIAGIIFCDSGDGVLNPGSSSNRDSHSEVGSESESRFVKARTGVPVHDAAASNAEEIERRSGVPVFGTIPYGNADEILREGKPVAVNWRLLAETPKS